MTEKEFNMYGMSEAEIKEEFLGGITAKLAGTEMVVAGILSDIQEMLQYGCEREEIRKLLNVAKFCLFESKETV